MSDPLYAVIMAGGGGTRLWPLSRRHRPKQVLRLFGDRSLFQMTVARLLPIVPAERILVVTVADQVEFLREQGGELPAENFIIEPSPRGTASVVGLAAIELIRRNPDATMACLPADHFVQDDERLRGALNAAAQTAQQEYLVTLGLKPAAADAGYGYIEKGQALESAQGFNVFEVRSFKEKPSVELAERYVASGSYLWNAGIFVWRAEAILEKIGRLMPNLREALDEIANAEGDWTPAIERVWPDLETETIDYGVMEKAQRSAMVEAGDIGWWDVGSWDRLLDLLPKDSDGNVVLADDISLLDTSGSLVYQLKAAGEPRLVAIVGAENLIVVDAGDAVLVTSRDKASRVRDLVKRLEAGGEGRYL
jgi:mannose-1-phosphate guanylyltransferase